MGTDYTTRHRWQNRCEHHRSTCRCPEYEYRRSMQAKHRADVPVDSCRFGRHGSDATPCEACATYAGEHKADAS